MKAVTWPRYGAPDVLKYEEVPDPTPKEDEVLVKVHAAAVNAADWHLMRASPMMVRLDQGLFKPKLSILGADMAGTVEAVGEKVTQFKPGDEVYGDLSNDGFGAYAEYACAKEQSLARKPANLSFEEAAAVPLSGITALQGLRDKGKLQQGQHVLINGASGGVGTYAIQIAKAMGAEVTAVCSSAKVDMVRSLGADLVIDYKQENFTQNGQRYDLIVAANGYHPITAYKRSLTKGGRCVMIGGTGWQMFQGIAFGPLLSMFGSKSMLALIAKSNQEDLHFLQSLIEKGQVKPLIENTYPLQEVPEAIRYVEEGHASGKVVIRM